MMIGTNQQIKMTIKKIPFQSVGVELGVWKGNSSEYFAKKTRRLYLVDSWSVEPYKHLSKDEYNRYLDRYADMTGSRDPQSFQMYYDQIHAGVVEKFSDNLNVSIWRMDTDKFFKTFNEKVDWFYVDAAHDEDGVYKDLCNTRNHLLKYGGGLIFGDDYGNKAGVVAGVDKFVEEFGLTINNFYANQYEIKIK
jgi:hypothetical protein